MFIIPVSIIATIGAFGALAYLRPSVARIPLLLAAFVYFLATMLIIMSTPFLKDSPAGIIIVPLILGGYTFLFAEKKDLLILKGAFLSITDRV